MPRSSRSAGPRWPTTRSDAPTPCTRRSGDLQSPQHQRDLQRQPHQGHPAWDVARLDRHVQVAGKDRDEQRRRGEPSTAPARRDRDRQGARELGEATAVDPGPRIGQERRDQPVVEAGRHEVRDAGGREDRSQEVRGHGARAAPQAVPPPVLRVHVVLRVAEPRQVPGRRSTTLACPAWSRSPAAGHRHSTTPTTARDLHLLPDLASGRGEDRDQASGRRSDARPPPGRRSDEVPTAQLRGCRQAVDEVPVGAYLYEPKSDGFRPCWESRRR